MALYGVFRTIFLQPPTAVRPDRLVRIETGNGNQISLLNFGDLEPGSAFDGLAAYAMIGLNLRSGEGVERVQGMMVTPAFFDLLGVRTAVGHSQLPATDSAAVITEDFRRRRLADQPNPIGAVLHLNGRPFTVVGVLPQGYRAVTGALGPEVFVPIAESLAPGASTRGQSFLTALGRMRDGVTMRQAETALTPQLQALERTYPDENIGLGRASFVFPVAGLGSWRTRASLRGWHSIGTGTRAIGVRCSPNAPRLPPGRCPASFRRV